MKRDPTVLHPSFALLNPVATGLFTAGTRRPGYCHPDFDGSSLGFPELAIQAQLLPGFRAADYAVLVPVDPFALKCQPPVFRSRLRRAAGLHRDPGDRRVCRLNTETIYCS